MKEYRTELNNLTVKLIRNEDYSVIKKISLEDLNKLGAGNTSKIIQDLFFLDDIPSIFLFIRISPLLSFPLRKSSTAFLYGPATFSIILIYYNMKTMRGTNGGVL